MIYPSEVKADVSWNSKPVALRFEAAQDDSLPQIADGVEAFRRREYPQPDWHPAKLDGWNMAGMMAYHRSLLEEGA